MKKKFGLFKNYWFFIHNFFSGSIHMLNNQPFDSACYHHLQTRPNLQRSQTNGAEYQLLTKNERKYSQSGQKKLQYFQRTHSAASKSAENQSFEKVNPNSEKLSPEMKKKLANDLLTTLMSIRAREVREMRKRLEQEEAKNSNKG